MSRIYQRQGKPWVTAEELNRYFNDIPYQYYEALALNIDGDSYAEIAEKLVIPIGTVKSRISRAKIKYKRLEEARIAKEKVANQLLQEEVSA